FFLSPATTELSTLSLHDALPICDRRGRPGHRGFHRSQHDSLVRADHLPLLDDRLRAGDHHHPGAVAPRSWIQRQCAGRLRWAVRSEEHTSELQSLAYLVCRLLLE